MERFIGNKRESIHWKSVEKESDVQQVVYSNQIGSRGRRPWLLFVRGDEIIPFNGENITGVAVVRGTDYEKSGKWSHTTYRLQLADDIRHISGRDGWETGTFAEGLGSVAGCKTPDTWAEMGEALGISVPSAMQFLRRWRPKAAKKLDEVEEALMELDEVAMDKETDFEKVTVSFGSPTNRAIREGYWESPKEIPGYEAEIRLKNVDKGWTEENITIVGAVGTVLSVEHSRGMHGGYYAVSVAIVPGTETNIPTFKTADERAAEESGLPEDLYRAFDGDTERIRTFMKKVENLNVSDLDEREISAGRKRKHAEVVRVSGDPDFFLGADPLEVWEYIENSYTSDTFDNSSFTFGGSSEGEDKSWDNGNTALRDAMIRAKSRRR